jgi:hypothetical protein
MLANLAHRASLIPGHDDGFAGEVAQYIMSSPPEPEEWILPLYSVVFAAVKYTPLQGMCCHRKITTVTVPAMKEEWARKRAESGLAVLEKFLADQ